MKTYKSAAGKAETELIIKRSRFITRVFPVNTEKEAEAHLGKIREQHKDATHNVYAWQVGITKTVQRCSDDGEPGGTAGRPVLEVIKQNDLVNILIVVTRYFGGIKLGAGGLIRAYSQAAREGLEKAGVVEKALHAKYRVTIDYPLANIVQAFLEKKFKIIEVDYGEQVSFIILALEQHPGTLIPVLKDASKGQAVIEDMGTEFYEI